MFSRTFKLLVLRVLIWSACIGCILSLPFGIVEYLNGIASNNIVVNQTSCVVNGYDIRETICDCGKSGSCKCYNGYLLLNYTTSRGYALYGNRKLFDDILNLMTVNMPVGTTITCWIVADSDEILLNHIKYPTKPTQIIVVSAIAGTLLIAGIVLEIANKVIGPRKCV
jgi:hypothetical protein